MKLLFFELQTRVCFKIVLKKRNSMFWPPLIMMCSTRTSESKPALESRLRRVQVLGQGRLVQVRIGKVRLGQIRLGQVRLGQVRLGQVRLGSVRLGQVQCQEMKHTCIVRAFLMIMSAEHRKGENGRFVENRMIIGTC